MGIKPLPQLRIVAPIFWRKQLRPRFLKSSGQPHARSPAESTNFASLDLDPLSPVRFQSSRAREKTPKDRTAARREQEEKEGALAPSASGRGRGQSSRRRRRRESGKKSVDRPARNEQQDD